MLLEYALKHDLLEERHLRTISPHQANLRIAWVFSRFMQNQPGGDPASVNRIMNVFCRALGEVGQATTLRFLQDRYTLGEYLRIMLTTARYYPKVVPLTAQALGVRGLVKWVGDIGYFAADEALRKAHGIAGVRKWKRVERLSRRIAPAAALRQKALRTGWEATK